MAGPFTQPDPLVLNSKTLSIYITELQVCVNDKRQEISQIALTFINQNIGKIMRLDAIEELKERVNTLAIDFGFTGGVTNSELLGRDYVTITNKFGKKVCHFPIINDLRRVLESLELKILFEIGIVVQDYWRRVIPADPPSQPVEQRLDIDGTLFSFPITATNKPWSQIPIFHQGVPGFLEGVTETPGTFCPEGFPTCENNFPGFSLSVDNGSGVFEITDISILQINNFDGDFRRSEGPLGGPYNEMPKGGESAGFKGDGVTPFDSSSGSSFLLDEGFMYLISTVNTAILGEVDIFKRVRDGRLPWTKIITHPDAIRQRFSAIQNFMGRDNIIFFDSGAPIPGSPKIAWINTTTGAFSEVSLGFLNLNPTPEPGTQELGFRIGTPRYRNGAVEFTYASITDLPENPPDPRKLTLSSGVARIPEGFTGTFNINQFNDISIIQITSDFDRFLFTKHAIRLTSGSIILINIFGAKNSGVWYDAFDVGVGGEAVLNFSNSPDVVTTFNGSTIYATGAFIDYKGDLEEQRKKVFSSDIYVERAGVTSIITNNAIPVASNRTNVSPGIDEVTITVGGGHIIGTFRYKILRRKVGETVFSDSSEIESTEDPLEIVIFGLDNGVAYEFRIDLITGQGDIIGQTITTVSEI